MRLTLSKDEFEEVRKILSALHEDQVTLEFNHIFENHGNARGIKGWKIDRTDSKIIDVPEKLVLPILKAITKNGFSIKELIHMEIKISMLTLGRELSKLKRVAEIFDKLLTDLKNAIK